MKLGNQKKKKNNKGFSLVELIVVVLIIAIIAVALAPQVMKWVGKAKENVAVNDKATLKTSLEIVVAECKAENIGCSFNGKIEADTFKGSITGITEKISEILNGQYPKTASGGYYTVVIDNDGKITITP